MGDPREYEGDNFDDEEKLPEPNEDELEEDDGGVREAGEEEPGRQEPEERPEADED